MKFTDGFWMTREGYQIQNPTDIRDIVQKDNSVTVYAATKYIRSKGDTLNGTLLKATYRLTYAKRYSCNLESS